MSRGRPLPVGVVLAAFRVAARLLPRGFREAYFTEGASDLEETLSTLYARRGTWATARSGTAAVLDLVRRIPVEWWATLRGRVEKRGPASDPGTGERLMSFLNDFRVAGRSLARRPAYAAAAVLTLALGIGATVAIFSVVNTVLLRPLSYPEADRIVSVNHHAPGLNLPELGNSQGTLNFYRERADFFSAFAGYRSDARNLIGGPDPDRVAVVAVQPPMFDVLGVQPALGRPFGAADATEGAAPVAILTDAAWRARFGADPTILGRTIELDGVPTEVVGVMPPGFSFGDREAVALVPFPVDPDGAFGAFGIRAVARLAPGIDLATASGRATGMQAGLPEFVGGDLGQEFLEQAGWSVTVQRLQDSIVGEEVTSALWVVLATVGFLLLIACANVANLFLVRAEARQKELAVRAAMGAGGGRIATGLLSEALLLGAVGGVAGVLLAWGGVTVLVSQGPPSLPRLYEVRLDAASLGLAAALSVVASLAFGAIPMLRYSGAALARILRDGGRASTEGRERHRARSVLVTAQLALALMLLVGSGLMLRTFDRLRSVDPGFDAADVMTVGLSVGTRSTAEAAAFYERVAQEIAALPGVTQVGLTQRVPLGSGSANGSSFDVEGEPRPEDVLPTVGMYKVVGEAYADALRIPVVSGRMLTRSDYVDDAGVVVVNQTFAELLGGDAAVGKAVRFGDDDSAWLRVVGVIGDVHEEDLREPVRAWAYVPMASTHLPVPLDGMFVVVRMQEGMDAPVAGIRQAVARIDPTVPLTTLRTMDEVMAESLAQTSFTMVLLGIAAGVALFLGAIGLFGVMSYVVGQRTREIGVRVALGAAGADIRGMVFRQSAGVALAGVVIGLAGSLALTRLMGTILFGISTRDPVTFLGAPLLLVAVAALATWLPARRASRVDPIEALRAD